MLFERKEADPKRTSSCESKHSLCEAEEEAFWVGLLAVCVRSYVSANVVKLLGEGKRERKHSLAKFRARLCGAQDHTFQKSDLGAVTRRLKP